MPKTYSKTPVRPAAATKRRLKQPKYKSFRVSKRIHQPKTPLTGAFRLFGTSIKLLINKWRLFGGIVFIYMLLTIIFVRGFGVSSNIGQLKSTIVGLFHGSTAGLSSGLALFGILLSNANSTSSEVAGAYQSMLLVIISLVLIWAFRHTLANNKTKIRISDAFYKSLAPLISFLLVLIVISLQFIPMIFANFLYRVVISGGLAVTLIEKVLWILLTALFVILTLYMVSSSIFALYIVTLPDMRPMQALRSARNLVLHRRWVIMRKIVFLPVMLLFLAALFVVPIILVSPVTAEWLFFVLSMMALAVAHSYMYHLYRELL